MYLDYIDFTPSPLPRPPHVSLLFSYSLLLFFLIAHWVQLMTPTWTWVCGHWMEHALPISSHIPYQNFCEFMTIMAVPCPEAFCLVTGLEASCFGALPSEEKKKKGLYFLSLQELTLPWRTRAGYGAFVHTCNTLPFGIVFLCLWLMAMWWGAIVPAFTPSLSTGFFLVSITTAICHSWWDFWKEGEQIEWFGVVRPLCPWIKWRLLALP